MATIALLLWPFIALLIFSNAAIVPAIILATLVPYLFLPEAFSISLPGVPDLDKTSVISLGIVTGLLFFGERARKRADLTKLKVTGRWPRFLQTAFLATLAIGSILTVMNNREVLVFGPTVLPAMRAWDAIGLLGGLVLLLIPFFIASKYFATPDTHRTLLKGLVLSGLVYSILMLVEIRLSPQLHNWIYGYHQHSFLQHIRDGFRPMVFLEHGIWVGFFIFMSLLGAVGLMKAEQEINWLWAGGWLFIILMFSKNLGASVIGLLCLGIFFGLWRKLQIQVIVFIALATLSYPALRQAGLIPVDQILSAASAVSENRALSLDFRLNNEDQLLARALQKPLTGWGGWSRDRIFNQWGNEVSISEGSWILTLGAWGWLGYIGKFGLLTLPLISLIATARRKEIPIETIVLALICSGNLIYMIPNATLTPIGLICFGALAGFMQYDVAETKTPEADIHVRKLSSRRLYTRFPRTPK